MEDLPGAVGTQDPQGLETGAFGCVCFHKAVLEDRRWDCT